MKATTSFSMLINGEACEHIESSKGLRQGCPLSPYLLILCVDVLSRMISADVNSGKINGIKVRKNATVISYLCLADDIILFRKDNYIEALMFEGFLIMVWTAS